MPAYLNLEATLHDAFWAGEGDPAELPLLGDFLARHPGRSLEIGCGSGRLLLPLLARGFDVEGLDNSPDMLGLCREHAAGQQLSPLLHSGDMLAFSPPSPCSSLLLPAFTFQFAADPAAALHRFSRILGPGGAIYLTVFRPLAELAGELPKNEWFADHQTTLPAGRRATLESRHGIDRLARTLVREHRYAVFAPGDNPAASTVPAATHTSTHRLRWFEPGELENHLATAGFAVTRRIAEFDPATPVGEDTQILTVHAQRSD